MRDTSKIWVNWFPLLVDLKFKDLKTVIRIKKIKGQLLALSVILTLFSCANIVQPSGGPKDTQAPEIKEIEPANQSVNFDSKKIVFTFDEYIQLQDINNQFFISPPLKNIPDFTVKNKSLVVTIDDTLKPNTTYNINFGDAIKDINEGNILTNATYAFSTGPYIDSLSLLGNVKNAQTLEAEKGVLIMLYDKVVDSLPMKQIPTYYTKCDEAGNFRLDNLKGGNYKLIALNDKNRNLLFDLPEEEAIGFMDSLVSPVYIPKPVTTKPDTVSPDTAKSKEPEEQPEAAKAARDSVVNEKVNKIQVWTFVEEKSFQYLKKSLAIQYGKLAFIYNLPVETLNIKPLNIEIENMGWAFREFSDNRDTVYVWLPEAEDEEGEGEIPHVDTIRLEVQADGFKKDTVDIPLLEKGEKVSLSGGSKGSFRKTVQKEDFNFVLFAPGKNKVQHPERGFEVRFNHPVAYSTLKKIELREDSSLVEFTTTPNPERLRSFLVNFPWKAGKNYELFIPPNTFRDLFALPNDSFLVSFKGGDVEEFANLVLNLKTPDANINYVVQLLDDKGKLIEEKNVNHKETITFSLLQPGAYQLKLIYDENNNKKWDTGNYLKQKQAEKIVVYPEGNITIRPNWDVEIEWNLGKETDKNQKR